MRFFLGRTAWLCCIPAAPLLSHFPHVPLPGSQTPPRSPLLPLSYKPRNFRCFATPICFTQRKGLLSCSHHCVWHLPLPWHIFSPQGMDLFSLKRRKPSFLPSPPTTYADHKMHQKLQPRKEQLGGYCWSRTNETIHCCVSKNIRICHAGALGD